MKTHQIGTVVGQAPGRQLVADRSRFIQKKVNDNPAAGGCTKLLGYPLVRESQGSEKDRIAGAGIINPLDQTHFWTVGGALITDSSRDQ